MKMPMCYDKLFERFKDKELNNGVTTYTLRENKQIAQATLQRLRKGTAVRMEVICRLCYLLDCQPGDIMEYVRDDSDMSGKALEPE